MKAIQTTLADFVKPSPAPGGGLVQRETRQCSKHGPYVSKNIPLCNLWTPCPDCQDEEEAAQEARKEDERKIKAFDRQLQNSGLSKRFYDKSFANYLPQTSAQRKIMEAAQGFAADFKAHLAAGRCLALLGGAGQGKTHLGVSIMREVIWQGYTAKYAREYDFLRSSKATWSSGGSSRTEAEIAQSHIEPDLLVLDEIGVQFFSHAEIVLIFQIMDGRYGGMKPTVIISNLRAPRPDKEREGDGQPNRTQTKDVEDALGFRSYDRIIEGGGLLLEFPESESYRKREATDDPLYP